MFIFVPRSMSTEEEIALIEDMLNTGSITNPQGFTSYQSIYTWASTPGWCGNSITHLTPAEVLSQYGIILYDNSWKQVYTEDDTDKKEPFNFMKSLKLIK